MIKELTLEDLATISGLPVRTLRFYIQEGVLQGPDTHGKNARYSQQHLDQLELIRRLKKLRLPLQEIRQLLNNMTSTEIIQIQQYQDILQTLPLVHDKSASAEISNSEPGTSALTYIHNLEQDWTNIRKISDAQDNISFFQQSSGSNTKIYKNSQSQATGKHEIWTRILIEDGLEINFRQPKAFDDQAKIINLVEYARNLYKVRTRKGEKNEKESNENQR